MESPASIHPADETLVSYGLGKLDDTVAGTVSQHLEQCAPCRQRVAELSGDSFVGRLRQAQPQPQSAQPQPARPAPRTKTLVEDVSEDRSRSKVSDKQSSILGRLASSKDSVGVSQSGSTLPPELVNHPQYDVIRELGRGGMGVVYLARNKLMDRLEVLKLLSQEMLGKPERVERFLREIQAAAKLHHPNVVAAYTAFPLGKMLVFAMEYVEGDDLAKLVRARGPLPVLNACYFVYQTALGLQHAHERGMIHRDIKPGNLILFRQGKKGTVKILDFGLAKVSSEQRIDGTLTQQGQMLGTPDYIAPEQTLDAQKADIRSDIYSLGCTLYHLLTGSPPFSGNTLYAILQAHHATDAKPLNLVRPEVPVELAAVVAKMMAKEPSRRDQTPAEVAQALKPFLKPGGLTSRQPELSHGVSQIDRPSSVPVPAAIPLPDDDEHLFLAPMPEVEASERWKSLIDTPSLARSPSGALAAIHKRARRQPPWMWPSVAVGIVILAVMTAIVVIYLGRTAVVIDVQDPGVEVAVKGTTLTVTGPDQQSVKVVPGDQELTITCAGLETITKSFTIKKGEKKTVTVSILDSKLAAWLENEIAPPTPIREEKLTAKPLRTVPAQPHGVPTSPAPADALLREQIPPYELAVAGGGNPEKAPPELVAILGDSRLNHWGPVRSLSYSRDGKTLATASADGTARLWETGTGKLVRCFEGYEGSVGGLALSPDGTTLATGSDDATVKFWDVGSGRLRMSLEKQPGKIRCVAFSADGELLAGAVFDGKAQVCIWEAMTGRFRRIISIPLPNNLHSVVFSPDGKTLAASGGWWQSAEEKGWVRLFDLDTGNARHVLTHPAPVHAVAFGPDGKTLASASADGNARLWDSATGHETRALKGQNGNWVNSASFSPDGKMLATGCSWHIKLWEVATGEEKALLNREADPVAFGPDGKTLASGDSWNHTTVRLWDVATRQELPVSGAHTHSVNHLAISQDGKSLACGGDDSPVSLWDVATGQKYRELEGHVWGVTTASAFSPVGNVLASGGRNGTLVLWDATTGRELKTLTGHTAAATALSFSGDGKTLASGSADRTVRLWDLTNGGEAWRQLEGHSLPVRSVAFSPDGKTLGSGGDDKSVKLWDLVAGQLRATLDGHEGAVRSVAFTPDGETLISAGADKTVRLWDVSKNQVRTVLEGHTAAVTSVALSPDGQMLASSGEDGTVRLRDTAAGRVRQLFQLGPLRGCINGVVFTPDGRHLATANGNGTVYILRLPARLSSLRGVAPAKTSRAPPADAAAEPVKSTANDQRRVWQGSGRSSFRNTGAGKWREEVYGGSATYNFDEVARTPEYVELIDKTRAAGGCRIRLLDTESQIIWGGRDKNWRRHQLGKWEGSATVATIVSLFNGKDLSGWTAIENGGSWTVDERGVLVGKGSRESGKPLVLIADQAKYKDFKLSVRILNAEGAAISAIIRRSASGSQYSGYGIMLSDTQNSAGLLVRRGSLYRADMLKLSVPLTWDPIAKPSHVGEWYTLEITAIGNHITTSVDGIVVAEYEDPGKPFESGGLALVGRADVAVQVREIAIQELGGALGGFQRPRGNGFGGMGMGMGKGKGNRLGAQTDEDPGNQNGSGTFGGQLGGGMGGAKRKGSRGITIESPDDASPKKGGFGLGGGGFGGGMGRSDVSKELGFGAASKEKFVRLFNGSDFTNWTFPKGGEEKWSIEDGVLRGDGRSHIATARTDFNDFHLRMSVRTPDQINKHLIFRSRDVDGNDANYRFHLGGIRYDHKSTWPLGSYTLLTGEPLKPGESGTTEGLVKLNSVNVPFLDDKWHRVEIFALRNVFRMKLDDHEVSAFRDAQSRLSEGRIMIGLVEGAHLELRDIEVNENLAKPSVAAPKKSSRKPSKPAPANDAFREGSVWKGSRTYHKGFWEGVTVDYELQVLKRLGPKFTGVKFDNGAGRNRLPVEGEIHGQSLSWREGSDWRMVGKLNGDTIAVQFQANFGNGRTEGDGELKRAE